MRKRIALILTALLLIFLPVLSGCTDEDLQLVAALLRFVLDDNTETTADLGTQENWAEDRPDSGAVVDIGQAKETASSGKKETQADESSIQTEVPEQMQPEEIETTSPTTEETAVSETETESIPWIQEDGEYLAMEDVALYIATYNHLPSNYITKNEAQDLGWVSSKGNLWDVAPGKCIGGDRFGNYEGLLPTKAGRKYTECDVNYTGGYRQSERIIFSNDGLVYYTADHYETFTLLYGEE